MLLFYICGFQVLIVGNVVSNKNPPIFIYLLSNIFQHGLYDT